MKVDTTFPFFFLSPSPLRTQKMPVFPQITVLPGLGRGMNIAFFFLSTRNEAKNAQELLLASSAKRLRFSSEKRGAKRSQSRRFHLYTLVSATALRRIMMPWCYSKGWRVSGKKPQTLITELWVNHPTIALLDWEEKEALDFSFSLETLNSQRHPTTHEQATHATSSLSWRESFRWDGNQEWLFWGSSSHQHHINTLFKNVRMGYVRSP